MRGTRLLFMVVLLWAGAAAAEPKAGKELARDMYRSGTQHYNLSEFGEALTAFKEAYRAFPDSTFLFNIAQCQRQLGDKAGAVLSYKAFLRERPDAPNRNEVNALITSLERSIQEEQSNRMRPPGGVMSPIGEPRDGRPGVTRPGEPKPSAVRPAEPTPVVTPTVPPPTETPVEPTPAPAEATPTLIATPAPAHTPVYKKWWLWTIVGVVVVGGVGLGVGLALAPANISHPQTSTTDGTINF